MQDLDPKNWIKEGSGLAVSVAYNLPENSKPSSSYKSKAKKIAKQQVALAGYRLAALLNGVFQ